MDTLMRKERVRRREAAPKLVTVYCCADCDKQFKRKDSLSSHRSSAHPQTTTTLGECRTMVVHNSRRKRRKAAVSTHQVEASSESDGSDDSERPEKRQRTMEDELASDSE